MQSVLIFEKLNKRRLFQVPASNRRLSKKLKNLISTWGAYSNFYGIYYWNYLLRIMFLLKKNMNYFLHYTYCTIKFVFVYGTLCCRWNCFFVTSWEWFFILTSNLAASIFKSRGAANKIWAPVHCFFKDCFSSSCYGEFKRRLVMVF